MLRIFLSYEEKDAAFATQLVTDLQDAGAEVVTACPDLDNTVFERFLGEELPQCQQLVVVQTPGALQSPRVRAIVDAALKHVQEGQMMGVLRVIAPTSDKVETQTVPAIWATILEFDASLDYSRALVRLHLHLGLGKANDISNAPPPASHKLLLDLPDLQRKGNKFSVAGTFHIQKDEAKDRPRRPIRYSHVSFISPFVLLLMVVLLILVVAGTVVFMHQGTTPVKSGSTKLLATILTATPITHATHPASSTQVSSPTSTPTQASSTQAPTPISTVTQDSPTQAPVQNQVPPTQPPAPTPTASTSNSAPAFRASGSYSKWWATTFGSAPGYMGTQQVGTLYANTNYMFCKVWGGVVTDSKGNYNHWWLWTDLDTPAGQQGWVSAYYLSKWGNDEAKDNNGNVIPNC